MIVLTTSTETQNFRFIPRTLEVAGITPVLTDDITLDDATLDGFSVALSGDYIEAQVNYTNLKENRFYTLRIEKENEGVIYKDKVFVTNQGTSQEEGEKYTINKNVYEPKSTGENDYIVI